MVPSWATSEESSVCTPTSDFVAPLLGSPSLLPALELVILLPLALGLLLGSALNGSTPNWGATRVHEHVAPLLTRVAARKGNDDLALSVYPAT